MPTKKHHGPSPWEVTEFHDPGAFEALPDDLLDARLLAPEPLIEEAQRGYRLLATAVITQALQDLARQAREDLDAALETLQQLTAQEPWGTWLAVLHMEPETLCEALSRRLERGEVLKVPPLYQDKLKRAPVEGIPDGAAAAAD